MISSTWTREFVGARAEEVSLHADVVADVEQLVELKAFFADVVEPDVNLQALAALLKMREAGLALHANGHDASGDADVDARRFQLRPVLAEYSSRICGMVCVVS